MRYVFLLIFLLGVSPSCFSKGSVVFVPRVVVAPPVYRPVPTPKKPTFPMQNPAINPAILGGIIGASVAAGNSKKEKECNHLIKSDCEKTK